MHVTSVRWWGSTVAVAVVMLVCSCPQAQTLTVMSVDFGTEFMKVAVVAPGVPMEIALNKESKRKTPVAISFRDGERTFGDDALQAGMRDPATLFTHVLHLLGKTVDHPIVTAYQRTFPQHTIIPHPVHHTVIFTLPGDGGQYSVEELVAQLLCEARDQASVHTGQPVKDVVITVPAFFNQAERRALLQAAHIAQLKVLSLISSNAAVALNYGMFRRKEINATVQHMLFYDMGASQTTATVVAYQTIKTKERGYSETNPQLTVLGVGFDRTLGGFNMQLRLRDFLGRKFMEQKKTQQDVFESPRALNRLSKEAARLKMVLSANNEHVSQVENVMEDVDLRVLVRRVDLEQMCEDLVARAAQPVSAALVAAGMDITAIDHLILVGGATRMPAIQRLLQGMWGAELGRNINADEAAAMGAVYRAADMGQGFKVKKFHVKEANLYPIEVEFERTVEQDDGTVLAKVVRRSLFAVGNGYPQKKVMTFNKHTADFTFRVNYGDMTQHMTAAQIREQFAGGAAMSLVHVTGVTDAHAEHVVKGGAEFKGIKAHFVLDGSGVLSLGGVEMLVERNVTVEVAEATAAEEQLSAFNMIGSTLTKLFSGAEDGGQDNVTLTADADNATVAADSNDDNKTVEAANGSNGGAAAAGVEVKLVAEKIVLNYTAEVLDLTTLTDEQLTQAIDKLTAINEAAATRERAAAGRNSLETLILDIRDKMTTDEYKRASTPDVVAKLAKHCAQMEEWLYEDGFDAAAEVYDKKVAVLDELFKPVDRRVVEHRQRPQALQALQDILNMSSVFLGRAREKEAESWFTDVELTSLDDIIIATQAWLEVTEERQQQQQPHEDPSLSLASIGEKIQDMDREMKYLVNKAKMAKAKAEKDALFAKLKAEKEAKEAEKEEKKKKKREKEEKQKKEGESVEESSDGEAARQEPPLPEAPIDAPADEAVETAEDVAAAEAVASDDDDSRPSLADTIQPDGVEEEETHTEL